MTPISVSFHQHLTTHPLYSTVGPVIQSWCRPHSSPALSGDSLRDWYWHEERRRGLHEALTRLSGEDIPGKDWIEEYLHDQYRRHLRPATFRNSLTAIAQFLAFVKLHGKTTLTALTRDDLGAWIEHEQDRGVKASTVKMRLRSVNAFLRCLIDREVIEPAVLSKRMIIKLPDPLPRAIAPDELGRLLSVIDHTRDRAMILVLLRTGMRIGELLNTLVDDVNLTERTIAIYEARKSWVGRMVYLSDDALSALKAWWCERHPHKHFLFYGQGRHRMSYQAARARFVSYLATAGLIHKGYTLHCLRHTCATDLLNAGMRLECVQQLLGHSSIEMTRRYARLSDKRREKEYFRAMAIIERGQSDVSYQLDHHLPATVEAEELLPAYREELPHHPDSVRHVGGCSHREGDEQNDPALYRLPGGPGPQAQDDQLSPR